MTILTLLDECVCAEHGVYAHVALHEAAHAVFATVLGFDFTHVTVATPREILMGMIADQRGRGGTVAGGVHLVASPTTWVPSHLAAEAMDFCMAGHHAEIHELGHRLPRGWEGDANLYGLGMGWNIDPPTRETVRDLIAQSNSRLAAAVPDNIEAIRRVRDAFLLQRSESGADFDSQLVLTAGEVAELAAG